MRVSLGWTTRRFHTKHVYLDSLIIYFYNSLIRTQNNLLSLPVITCCSLRHTLDIVSYHARDLVEVDELVAADQHLGFSEEHDDVAADEVGFEATKELLEIIKLHFLHTAIVGR